jgi:hypothetical protein
MAKARKRTIVGSPLTPDVLTELGAVTRLPAPTPGFDPDGNWENMYRIWTCHGYRESGNQTVGSLRIRRTGAPDAETVMLHVEQTVIETDGILHTIEAQVACSKNECASPVTWRLSSGFRGPDGEEMAGLGTTETGSLADDVLTIETSDIVLKRHADSPLTCEWSLFDVVQRRGAALPALPFHMLEGLRLVKPAQRLSYRGRQEVPFGAETMSLDCFEQVGRGILPTEYWLGADHRLLAVTSMNKAYLLDDTAAERTKERMEQLRRSYRR